MAEQLQPEICVIGGGPAGYAAAMRAIDLGKRTLLIERDRIGGTGIYNGALTSKTLWEIAQRVSSTNELMRSRDREPFRLSWEEIHRTLNEAVFERKYLYACHIQLLASHAANGNGTLRHERGTARFTGPHTARIDRGRDPRRQQLLVRTRRRLGVERTHFLTDIAAEQPVTNPLSQLMRYRCFAVFNRQVTDTTTCVQHTGFRKRGCRTGIKAPRTGTTKILLDRFVVCKLQIGQDSSQKEPAADRTTDQHRIFSKPPDPGQTSEITFQQRRRVDHNSVSGIRHCSSQECGKLSQAWFQHIMIIGRTPGVPRDASAAG